MKTVIIDSQKYLLPSWQDLDDLCFKMSQKIIADQKNFDRLITLIKGGLAYSRSLSDYLNIKNISTLQTSYYEDIAKTKNKPQILQKIPLSIAGEKIILFDDVIDSGNSIKTTYDYLLSLKPKGITLASLFLKEKSIIKPDYFGVLTNAWIIFPNERRKTVECLTKKWNSQGISSEVITSRLLSLNFPKDKIKLFSSKHV